MNKIATMFVLAVGSVLRSSILQSAISPSNTCFVRAYVTTTTTSQRSVSLLLKGKKASSLQLPVPTFGHHPRWNVQRTITSSQQLFSTLTSTEIDELNAKIKTKGDEIRLMKESGTTSKEELAPHIAELKMLKSQLPSATEGVAKDNKKKDESKKKSATTSKKKAPPTAVVEELSETELRFTRVTKIDTMRSVGVEPYEYTFARTHSADQLQNEYTDKLESGEEDTTANVSVAGRIMTRRVFGKLAFFTLQDSTGTIQLQFDQSRLNDSFQVSGFLQM